MENRLLYVWLKTPFVRFSKCQHFSYKFSTFRLLINLKPHALPRSTFSHVTSPKHRNAQPPPTPVPTLPHRIIQWLIPSTKIIANALSLSVAQVVDSRARSAADGSVQAARRQLEVFQSQAPGGRVQVVRTRTVSSQRWAGGAEEPAGDFEDLQVRVLGEPECFGRVWVRSLWLTGELCFGLSDVWDSSGNVLLFYKD